MPLETTLFGLVAVIASAIGNGSYYVPVKRHEVHDGLVYQWYQCSGILLGGIAFTMQQNMWDDPAGHFYIAWEGILSGTIWTLANVFATLAVKLCGLGVYFILHELTNIGGAFFVGVFGARIGLETTPPRNICLAAVGVVMVFIGTIPVVFLTPPERSSEAIDDDQASASPKSCSASLDEPNASQEVKKTETPERRPFGSNQTTLSDLFEPLLSPDARNNLLKNAATWDGSSSPTKILHRRSSSMNSLQDVATMPMILELDLVQEAEPNVQAPPLPGIDVQHGRWSSIRGVVYSFTCGGMWCTMYLPAPIWVKRMAKTGKHVNNGAFLFSVCLGIYTCSTLWMLAMGTWKRFQGQPMEKPVLRPALAAGIVWTVGCFATLQAVQCLPYAVAYCCSAGGALLVSLLWGVFVFGEAAGAHNQRCMIASFVSIFAGLLCLGISA